MHLLFCTLYPSEIGVRAEDLCTKRFLDEFSARNLKDVSLSILAGSAYEESVDRATAMFSEYPFPYKVVRIPFEYDPQFNARRPHEISFGKMFLTQQLLNMPFDVLYFADADTHVEFEAVLRYAQHIHMSAEPQFVRFPMVLRDFKEARSETLAMYLHSRQLLLDSRYDQHIYKVYRAGEKIRRRDAPDCAIKKALRRFGAREIPALDVTTRHHTRRDTYREYARGRISERRCCSAQIGFDPEVSAMAMEPDSCEAVYKICRSTGAKYCLDLGTGVGNSLRTLLNAGAERVVTIDEDSRFTLFAQSAFPASPRVHAITAPLVPAGHHRAYDLSCLKNERFDMVVIDGPKQNPRARILSAGQVHARIFLFHDAYRDEKYVRQFVETLKGRHRAVSCEHVHAQRGIAVVRTDLGSSNFA